MPHTRPTTLICVCALVALAAGCAKQAPEAAPAPALAPAPAAAATAPPEAKPAATAQPAATKPVTAQPVKRLQSQPARAKVKKTVEWAGPIAWTTYDDGLAEAKKTGKPTMLLVYADWCPKCRALGGPFASDTELHELSKKFVMIKQNQEERPGWLSRYGKFGGYVPRIFFLDAAGDIREDITAPHPKYPYFYASRQMAALKASMKKAAGG